ncbi:MAG: hypothetical protein Q7W45_04675 [Bacteroidota bacterium]|nr:hypothetical protein [Bacteroidota bacterium]MDP3144739.1 hypothetical protein [Bacteroidota bacterium]
MFKVLKVSIAVIICTAFVFRLSLINFNLITSVKTSQENYKVIKNDFSSSLTNKIEFQLSDYVVNSEYASTEICEEDSNELSQLKIHPFFLIQFLFAHFSSKTNYQVEKITQFYNYLSYASSHRYLSFQVFQI